MLKNKVAVITGAAAGIGRATAERFAREGTQVVLADVDQGGLEAAAQSIRDAGSEARSRRRDVSREAEVAALMAFAAEFCGGLDTVFNNAGTERPVTPSHEVTEERFDRFVDVNLKGTFFRLQARAPLSPGEGRGNDRQPQLGERLR